MSRKNFLKTWWARNLKRNATFISTTQKIIYLRVIVVAAYPQLTARVYFAYEIRRFWHINIVVMRMNFLPLDLSKIETTFKHRNKVSFRFWIADVSLIFKSKLRLQSHPFPQGHLSWFFGVFWRFVVSSFIYSTSYGLAKANLFAQKPKGKTIKYNRYFKRI